MSDTWAFVALLCVALGLVGGGAAFGYWFRGELESDGLVALDNAKRQRQGLAEVYSWPTDDGGGVA